MSRLRAVSSRLSHAPHRRPAVWLLPVVLCSVAFTVPTRPEPSLLALGEAMEFPAPEKDIEVEGGLGPARYRYTAADVHAALGRASARTRCIVRHEVGGYGYDPYVVGSRGERGPAQLASFGLLPLYQRWSGGAVPENPYAAIPFVDWALANGYARHWSPVVRGLC